jgi:hypothetical protein
MLRRVLRQQQLLAWYQLKFLLGVRGFQQWQLAL